MKKIFIKTIFALSLFSILLLASCAKEEEEPKKNLSEWELINLAPWLMTSAIVDPGIDFDGVIITDFFTQLDACQRDNTKKYDGRWVRYDEGQTKCDPNDPQTEDFLAQFDENTRTIWEGTPSVEKYYVTKVTETELIKYNIYDGEDIGAKPGIKYKFTYTYRH
jgi:hypothetical protein